MSSSKEKAVTPRMDLFSAFVELHILHHAAEDRIYGLWMIEELREHGYRIGPGTLYPLLHTLEARELLKSSSEIVAGKVRRYYRITPKGKRHFDRAKGQLVELVGEILSRDEMAAFLSNPHRR